MSLVPAFRPLLLAGRSATGLATTRSAITLIRHNSTNVAGVPEASPQKSIVSPTSQNESSKAINNAYSAVRPEIPIDHATSSYSPIPRHPEERDAHEVVAAAALSRAPLELQSRTVRIYKPAKPATQSGNWNGHHWKLDWDVLGRGHRWENGLMGWQSSADAMQATSIFFKTKEDAIHFAEKQGYDWFVQEPNERKFRVKSYSANFLHSPKKLKFIHTK